MIGWLQGKRIGNWQQGVRHGLVLACDGVGYEIQLLPRHLKEFESRETLTLWVHHLKREDIETLFGFPNQIERDLFRVLLGVNGIGPQMAISLLEECQIQELVDAIINGELDTISRAHGIGRRTAERLSIELRNKLSSFSLQMPDKSVIEEKDMNTLPISNSCLEELHKTLNQLGYENREIKKAITAVATENHMHFSKISNTTAPTSDEIDDWLKEILLWLSQETS